jgi:hypothetical protein
MPNHAGYAAAVTIRAKVFDDALLSAYHSGQIRHSFSAVQQVSPAVSANLFFESPRVRFVPTNRLSGFLRINGWGTVSVRVNQLPPAPRLIQWHADLRITPTAVSIGTLVLLSTDKNNYRMSGWQFDVLSGTPFNPAADAYLHGDVFRAVMETWLQDAIGNLSFPIIDFSYLGPFGGVSFTTVDVRCVDQALMLATNGDPSALAAFAGSNDIAVAVNPNAIKPMIPSAEQTVQDQIDQYDATLEFIDITCEEGRFRFRGRASMFGAPPTFLWQLFRK